VEGPTDDPSVGVIRARQVKNCIAVTNLSLGLPMLLMGDEMCRSQRGNNNAWCQDNEISWLNWDLLNKHADVHRFVRLLNRHRVMRTDSAADSRLSLDELLQRGIRSWHGIRLGEPDWSPHSHSIALHISCPGDGLAFYLIFNAYWETLEFELPLPEGTHTWRRWIDTSLNPPNDIVDWSRAVEVRSSAYQAAGRSVAVLFAGAS